ncbi:MAG TPA: hypothetical protein PKD53_19865 [Chloroflexaceae bacterium]|nr:hypothetical protein [Chloroflexaceae bacterium]
MDMLIVVGALALFLAMLLSSTPAPQPPTVVIMQSPPATAQPGGCLGLIFAVVIFATLVAVVSLAAR